MEAPFSNTGKIGNKKSDYAVLGLKSDLGATSSTGQESGADYLRQYSTNIKELQKMFYPNSGTINKRSVVDCGNLFPEERELSSYLKEIAKNVSAISRNTNCVISIGGDDSVSYGVARGLLDVYPNLGILHLDAHVDRYGEPNEPLDHSNWVEKLQKTTGVPISQHGTREITNKIPTSDTIKDRPLFISLDLDVLDPIYAPAVACPVSFGMTHFEVMRLIKSFILDSEKVVGIGITELVSYKDVEYQTVNLVNKMLEYLIFNPTFNKLR